MLSTDRRTFLIGGALASASALLPKQSTAAISKSSQLFDLSTPSGNLDAFVKVMGDLSGKPSWIVAQGRIYARRPNEMPLPILAVEGVRYVRFERTDEGYRFHLRDWAFYKDLESGEPIDRFDNPFTGAVNETRHILTGFYSWTLGPNGQEVPNYGGEAWLVDRPFLLPWTFDGDLVAVPLELLVKYVSGNAGGEWMNFATSAEALDDRSLTSAPTTLVWTGDSGWIRWMDMGELPGRTLWQSTGQKHHDVSELRPELVRAAERYFPGSFADPEGYEKTSYTVSPPDEVSQPSET